MPVSLEMPRKLTKLDVLGQADQVYKRLKNEPSDLIRQRLLAVKLGLEGEHLLDEIAEKVGRSRSTIRTWFGLFRSEGIEGLCRLRSYEGMGRVSQIPEEARKAIRKKVMKGDIRRIEDFRQSLIKKFGVEISYEAVKYWLRKFRAELG